MNRYVKICIYIHIYIYICVCVDLSRYVMICIDMYRDVYSRYTRMNICALFPIPVWTLEVMKVQLVAAHVGQMSTCAKRAAQTHQTFGAGNVGMPSHSVVFFFK